MQNNYFFFKKKIYLAAQESSAFIENVYDIFYSE